MRVTIFRKSVFAPIALISTVVCANGHSFSGGWSIMEIASGQGKSYSAFSITIDENGNGSVVGKY